MFSENIPSQISEFVSRPDSGRAIKLRANYFEITSLPEVDIHHYDVTITPEVPPAINRKVYKDLLQRANAFGDVRPVFDGRRNIYTAKPFPFGNIAIFDVSLPGAPHSFMVKIKKVADINMEELNRFIDGRCSISSNVLTGIMALNILTHHKYLHHPFPNQGVA